MKEISKNTLFFYGEKLFNLVKAFGFYAKKLQILSVSYFSQTKYYVFYVLFVILSFFPAAENSRSSLFCKSLLLFLNISSFFLFVFLNLPFTSRICENLIGKAFIDRSLPGHLKGLIPFFIFLLTFSTLGLIETFSINLRVNEYVEICETINNDLQSFREVPLTIPNMVEFEKILIEITETPEEIPSTGVLTDISRWLIKKFSLVIVKYSSYV